MTHTFIFVLTLFGMGLPSIWALRWASRALDAVMADNERLQRENTLRRARCTIPPAWVDGRGAEANAPVQLVENLPRRFA